MANLIIQRVGQKYPVKFVLGQRAIFDNNVETTDVALAGVELKPSYGVYVSETAGPTLGKFVLPTTAPTRKQGPNPGPAAYEIISRSLIEIFASFSDSDKTEELFSM